MSDVEEIKSRLSIDEVISQYLKFKKAGSSFIAICPFHNEKSPSFNISPSLGIYKCFGCGESGDIFSFVQKMEGITFPEALEKLASQAGVILTKKRDSSEKKKQAKEEKERLLKILEEATLFFQINLSENNQAENYLKKRGVNENIVRKFRLGFAKDSWHSLEEFLYSKNYKQEELIKIGLIKKNEKGKIYDRFRNRIIFPLFDLEDKPVAFSGRDLSGTKDIAKYLNSPETIFFNKSEVLYGLNFAKFEGRKRDYFIIVEGQMDLIMSHQIGFENTVAVSGTSLTTQHLKNLGRFSKNLIFAFDSDKAGIEAAFKGIKLALSENFDVKILDISRGMDPADVILENSKKWLQIVSQAKNIIDFFITQISLSDKNIKQKNLEMREKVYPFLLLINSPFEKGVHISKICQFFGIEREDVEKELKLLKLEKKNEKGKEQEKKYLKLNEDAKLDIFFKNNIICQTRKKILKHIVSIYFWQKSLKKNSWIKDYENILEKVKELLGEDIYNKILKLDKNFIQQLVVEIETIYTKNNKEFNTLEFDLNINFERLKTIIKKEKIDNLQKLLLKEVNSKKKEDILKNIQKIIINKNDK